MKISLIAAMAANRVIGVNNQLPWHLPADLAWFKRNTLGKPVIMGRKTYQSIGKALPGRTNIVLSSQAINDLGIYCVRNIEEALAAAGAAEEAMIIGGGELYRQFLPFAQRLYLTHVETDISGDAYFPDYQIKTWRNTFSENHLADEKNSYAYRFEVLECDEFECLAVNQQRSSV